MTRRPALLLLALALALPACSDEPARPPTSSTTPGAVSSSPAAGSPSAAPSSAPAAPSAAPSFAGDTRPDTEEPTGDPLTVTRVRVARQAGFDRVVLELDGPGTGAPGWRVEYTDDPRQDGSGDPVDVDGDAVLSVVLTGIGLPFDTGVDEVSGDPSLPGDLEVVTDVVLGSTFEGQYGAFIGVSGERPFTVQRLASPPRVVIDVAH